MQYLNGMAYQLCLEVLMNMNMKTELKVAYYSFIRVQEVYTTNVQI